jgi:hypothetical protein
MNLTLLFIAGFGIFFVISGFIGIRRRQFTFRYGRGFGSLPLTLMGIPALISSVALLIGGVVMFAPIGRALILNTIQEDDALLNVVGVAGLIIAIGGLGFGVVLQAAINVGEGIRRARNKDI